MKPPWFVERGYKHFDAPVGRLFAQRLQDGASIDAHSWSPLIDYVKRVKRYKPKEGRTVYKELPIMYASHRDACILSKFAFDLTRKLDDFYEREGLTTNVIGYRRLGKSNTIFRRMRIDLRKPIRRAWSYALTSRDSSTTSTTGC